MKIIIILMISMTARASARIGETTSACTKRYGKPVVIQKDDEILVYKKAGFTIAVKFWKGTAHQIVIQSSSSNAIDIPNPITDTQLKSLLSANLGKNNQKINLNEVFTNAYENEGETIYARHNTMKNNLMFSTYEFSTHLSGEKEKEEKEALKGF